MIMVEKHWEHFIHQADVGVRGIGNSKEEAFEQAALALTNVMTDSTGIEPKEIIDIRCEAPDDELLLVDWLNALIFETATSKLLFGLFDVRIDNHTLNARAGGEKIDFSKHHPAVEVKGATYTSLSVRKDDNNSWIAQCVVDV